MRENILPLQAPKVGEKKSGQPFDALRGRAVAACRSRGAELTSMREAVLAELYAADGPLGVYDITSRLGARSATKVAPNSVYRIMKLLQSIGLVRRIESKHAYCIVSCDPGEAGDILLMCDDCGEVTIIGTGEVQSAIAACSEAAGFQLTRQVVEVAGLCPDCGVARSLS